MSTPSRIFKAITEQGVRGSAFKLYAAMVDRWFDLRYGVDTCRWASLDSLRIVGTNRLHGLRYEPARTIMMRQLLRTMRPLVPPESALVDLGAGKGRILLIAAECGFGAATGVEFASELCSVARENCVRYRRRMRSLAQLKIVEGDVVDYVIGKHDNVFVLFNPFDDEVLRRVMSRIEESAARDPQRILIGAYNTDSAYLTDRVGGFAVIDDSERFGYRTTILSNLWEA